MDKNFDFVILGAGLTGLTCAYYLAKAGKKIKVVDINSHVGGVIETHEKNGFLYEKGPNTGILGSVEIAELFEELNGICEIELGNKLVSKRYILKNKKWEALPSGLTKAIKTPLFSFKDKLRLLGEPFRSKGTNPDETLAELVKRRMGNSFLDYAIDPFILGVYAGDPGFLVPKYALPKLYNLEQDYGSFIGGAIKKKFVKKTEREQKANRKIFTIKGGLTNLMLALSKKVGADNIELGITNIITELSDNGYLIKYIQNNEIKTLNTEQIVSTIPAFNIETVFPFIDKTITKDLQNVYYAPVVEIAVGFNKWNGIELDGFGGLIPHKENRQILGVMYMSSLFSGRAPEGGALISVFIGGARKPELTELNDKELFNLVKTEFIELMGIENFEPDLFEISRHNQAIPQYGKESAERFYAVDLVQNKYKGLTIAGNLHNGIGMADRVKQAKELTDKLI